MPSRSESVELSGVTDLPLDDYRKLVESITDYAIYLLDAQGHVVTWNAGAQRTKGYDESEIVGQHFSVFYTPEDRAAGRPQSVLDTVSSQGRFEEENWRLRKDGSRFWASVVMTALRSEQGEVVGFAKVTRDLTERHRAEEERRRSEERFRLLLENVADYAIYTLDGEGRVTSWNLGAERMKGYSSKEILGQPFERFFPDEDVAAGKPAGELLAAFATGRSEDEGWRVRKDGSRFWANAVLTALRDAEGTPNGFVKITRDLSARRRAEEQERRLLREQTARETAERAEAELRESRERYRELSERLEIVFEGVADGITVQDSSGRLVLANSAAARLSGRASGNDLANKTVAEMLDRFELFDTAGRPLRLEELPAERLLAGREAAAAVVQIRERGTERAAWLQLRASAVRAAEGEPALAISIWHDISVERRAALEAASAAKRLEEASRAKDEFLATVSHELRTPLNAIVGWSALLRGRVSEAAVAKPIEVIYRNALAQVRIIDDILDVSRVITGKFRIEPRSVDLAVIVRDAVDVVRPSADAKRINIVIVPAADPCLLVADPERLQQVVWNLLSNAVRFTDSGGRVVLASRRNGSEVELSVSDTGHGIDPTFLPYVFDRFKQGDSSFTRSVGGLGLGLAIVRHIVELHGGRVAVASEGLGKGATFTVTLPVRAVIPSSESKPRETEPASVPPAVMPSLSGLRVLVVDDEADARDLVSAVLAEAGAEVQSARSAPEAFQALQRFRPDVLVSDIGMPEEDGLSLLARVRGLSADAGGRTPALALTAFARDSDRSRALQAGFDAHLGKPVDPGKLAATVAELALPSRG